MSGRYDREEALPLIHRHLEQTLTDEEQRSLERLLADHEEARRDLVLAAALHQELFTLHELPALDQTRLPSPAGGAPAELPVARWASARATRRASRASGGLRWAPAVAAATFLIGLALILGVLRSDGTRGPGTRHDSARAPHDDAPRPRPESGPPRATSADAEAENALEEKIRADGLHRLAELDEKRKKLLQAPVPETPGPKDPELQKKVDLGLLEAERLRIEEDMKGAIAQAAKSFRERASAPSTSSVGKTLPDPSGPEAAVPMALVERVEGEGYLVRKEGRTPLRAGQEFHFGEGLETVGENSGIVLKCADKTRLELRGSSAAGTASSESDRGSPAGAGQEKRWVLARGTLIADVAKQPVNRPMSIKSPHAEATVLGTSLRVVVDPGERGATRLDVYEGKVRFARLLDRRSVDVSGGHFAVAAAGVALVSRPIAPPRSGTAQKPVVVSLTLMNADTGRPLLQWDPLEDGAVLSLSDLPTRNLNILAVTSPPTVGSVLFAWDNGPIMEGNAPYLIGGNDQKGRPLAWTPAPGDHTLVVTPYSGPPAANRREGTGAAGSGVTVRLRVR